MNGRIYDNAIGRFISPDPIIQEPNNLQSFNRYTYVMNRPLSLTDPSGFVSSGLEMVLGSGRSGGGAGGGGESENYAEPIMADPLSEQDSINTQSSGQDAETETTYEEVYDPFGYGIVVDVIETTVTIAGSGSGEETISTSSGSSSGIIDGGNGMGTGGGSGSLAQDNSASTGVTAEGLSQGDHTTEGIIQNKTEGNNPVGKATQGGTGDNNKKFENGSASESFRESHEAKGHKVREATGTVKIKNGESQGSFIWKSQMKSLEVRDKAGIQAGGDVHPANIKDLLKLAFQKITTSPQDKARSDVIKAQISIRSEQRAAGNMTGSGKNQAYIKGGTVEINAQSAAKGLIVIDSRLEMNWIDGK